MKLTKLAFLFLLLIGITSCSNKEEKKENNDSSNQTSSDCTGNALKDLENCYQSKNVNELASLYCEWATREANAKKSNNKDEENVADNHTDAIQRCSRKLSDDDKAKFKELTKDCKEY